MIHVLLTRTPLYSRDCSLFLVRLACVKRAASVDSEPGSNSRLNRLVEDGFASAYEIRASPHPTDLLDRFDLELRSEEHTSELQSPVHLVCRLLLEKKKTKKHT